MFEPTTIVLRGGRVHNLQGIDVEFPLGKLTVVTGVSGAGKSSLVFSTLYAESQRRYLQGFSAATRQFLEPFDRPDADQIGDLPPAIAVGHQPPRLGPRATVGTLTEILFHLRSWLVHAGVCHCPRCDRSVKPHGPGEVRKLIAAMKEGTRFAIAFPSRPDTDQSIAEWLHGLREAGLFRLQVGGAIVRLDQPTPPEFILDDVAWVIVDRLEADSNPPPRLTDSLETAFRLGQGQMALLTGDALQRFDQRWWCPDCNLETPRPESALLDFNDARGACPQCQGTGQKPKSNLPCPTCQGRRLNQNARGLRWRNLSIVDLAELTIDQLADYLAALDPPEDLRVRRILAQARERLEILQELRLGYLTPGRGGSSLSAGEIRRLQLANALSANLPGALYLFEEPAAGLHAEGRGQVAKLLGRLRDGGNTLVVIDHDRSILTIADHVVDLGPGAGEEGGRVVYQGDLAGLAQCETSLTGAWWREKAAVPAPKRRLPTAWLRLAGVNTHNLKNLSVDFPLDVFCAVTGVSGAGKSSLIEDTLVPVLTRPGQMPVQVAGAARVQDLVYMDQTPLPRSARSNPATLLKIYDDIREVYAATSDAKIRNLGPGAFSFNQPGGRCETCQGQGNLAVDMLFLPDAIMTCPECQGTRFTRPVLAVKVRGLSIAEALNLTAREAFRFFRAQAGLQKKLQALLDVGLDYLRLGQATDTLSGGEAQRLKLASRLATRRKPRTLFVLAEPTLGLHPIEFADLIACCNRLVDQGHTVLIVEHQPEIIQAADYVIELGPGAGPAGGHLVSQGPPPTRG